MTEHNEPPAEGGIMNAFEYAVLRHVRDLKEESKKRKLNPAEERFLRITDRIVQNQNHDGRPTTTRQA